MALPGDLEAPQQLHTADTLGGRAPEGAADSTGRGVNPSGVYRTTPSPLRLGYAARGQSRPMSLLDLMQEFDAALEWPLDDPFLADHEPSTFTFEGWTAPPSD